MAQNVLIIENDLRIALRLAETLERFDANIVGMTIDKDTAQAITEGENVDYAALSCGSAHKETAAWLQSNLGVSTVLLF